jgi:hypothetical protein
LQNSTAYCANLQKMAWTDRASWILRVCAYRWMQLWLGCFQFFCLFLANPRYFARFLILVTLTFPSIPTEYLNFCYIFPLKQRFIVPNRAQLHIFLYFIFFTRAKSAPATVQAHLKKVPLTGTLEHILLLMKRN